MRKTLYRITVVITVLLLSACAARPPLIPVNANQHQAKLNQLTSWQIRGKLAFKSDQDKFSANLNWRQLHNDYRLNLSSFIGTQLLLLEKQGPQITLDYDDNSYQHLDANQLLQDLLGWSIPVDQLQLWVKGELTDEARGQFDQNGLLESIQTPDGWLINFSKYQKVDQYLLPHQLTLTAEDILIKIRISQWKLN